MYHIENLDKSIKSMRANFANNKFGIWTDESIEYFESLNYLSKKRLLEASKNKSDELIFEALYKDDLMSLIGYYKHQLGFNMTQIKYLITGK